MLAHVFRRTPPRRRQPSPTLFARIHRLWLNEQASHADPDFARIQLHQKNDKRICKKRAKDEGRTQSSQNTHAIAQSRCILIPTQVIISKTPSMHAMIRLLFFASFLPNLAPPPVGVFSRLRDAARAVSSPVALRYPPLQSRPNTNYHATNVHPTVVRDQAAYDQHAASKPVGERAV